MTRTHFKLSADPLPEGLPYDMACGSKILNSKFCITLEPGEHFPSGANTLMFCSKCLRISLSRPDFGKHYVYGVVEGETAHAD